MDQEPSQVREDVAAGAAPEGRPDEAPRDPEQIRRDIEQTREELGETVDQLAQKADVKGQARARVEDAKQQFSQKRDEVFGKAREASPESVDPDAVAAKARENQFPLAVGGALLAGFVLGRLTKRS